MFGLLQILHSSKINELHGCLYHIDHNDTNIVFGCMRKLEIDHCPKQDVHIFIGFMTLKVTLNLFLHQVSG